MAGQGEPTQDEIIGWMESLSNWGRWGDDDRLGTLNHLTPERRAAALAGVQTGQTVSLAWDLGPDDPRGNTNPPERTVLASGEPDDLADGDLHSLMRSLGVETDRAAYVFDEIRVAYHGMHITHLDSLAHAMWDGKLYNGVDAAAASRQGATEHEVVEAAGGIVGRGVLLDAARHRGVDWLEAGEPIGVDELRAIADATDVEIQPGDILVLRTGNSRRRHEDPDWNGFAVAGWGASAVPWFHEHDVAAVAADVPQDPVPFGYTETPQPVHNVGIVAMGLWLVDNCDLETLAAACEAHDRWTFAFMLAPLRLSGISGSPANPLAVF